MASGITILNPLGGATPSPGGSASNLDASGDPTGVVTPQYTGQYYRDTATGNIWKSTGTTSADWTLQVQDMGWRWTPTNINWADITGYYTSYIEGEASLLTLSYLRQTTLYLEINYHLSVSSVSLPNLTAIDVTGNTAGGLKLYEMPLLTSINAPLLTVIGGSLLVSYNNALVSFELPSLTTIGVQGGALVIKSNPLLTTVNLPLLTSFPGACDMDLTENAFDAATVNAFLALAVSNPSWPLYGSKINLSGGTNATPTGQGVIDKATLNSRVAGCAITN